MSSCLCPIKDASYLSSDIVRRPQNLKKISNLFHNIKVKKSQNEFFLPSILQKTIGKCVRNLKCDRDRKKLRIEKEFEKELKKN